MHGGGGGGSGGSKGIRHIAKSDSEADSVVRRRRKVSGGGSASNSADERSSGRRRSSSRNGYSSSDAGMVPRASSAFPPAPRDGPVYTTAQFVWERVVPWAVLGWLACIAATRVALTHRTCESLPSLSPIASRWRGYDLSLKLDLSELQWLVDKYCLWGLAWAALMATAAFFTQVSGGEAIVVCYVQWG